MANLGRKGELDVARFRYLGKEYKKSLRTSRRADAEAAMHGVERAIHALATGLIQVPPGVDPGDYILSGGTLREPDRPRRRVPPLSSLVEEYLGGQRHKAPAGSTPRACTCGTSSRSRARRPGRPPTGSPAATWSCSSLPDDHGDRESARPGRAGRGRGRGRLGLPVPDDLRDRGAPPPRPGSGRGGVRPRAPRHPRLHGDAARGGAPAALGRRRPRSGRCRRPESQAVAPPGRDLPPDRSASRAGARARGVEATTAPRPIRRRRAARRGAIDPDRANRAFWKPMRGTPWCLNSKRNWFKVGFYTYRHSFASNLAARGVDQRVIDEWMGHQTEAMRERYRHLFPKARRSAMASFSFAVEPPSRDDARLAPSGGIVPESADR